MTSTVLNSPVTSLNSTLSSLLYIIGTLPPQIKASLNETQIQSTFSSLSTTLSPFLDNLSTLELQTLFSNLTWINENLNELTDILYELPIKILERSNRQDLVGLISLGTTSFSILSVASPDVW